MAARSDFTGKGPVLFEGVELPSAVKAFHLLPFWNELDDEMWLWLHDLHYCWGRTREARSKDVLRYVQIVRAKLAVTSLESIHASIKSEHPECDEAGALETVADWNKALDLMENAAKSTRVCRWTVQVTDESLEKNLKILIATLRGDVKLPEGGKLSPLYEGQGVEFKVRRMDRDQQIALMHMIGDGLSDKRPGPIRKMFQRLLRALKF